MTHPKKQDAAIMFRCTREESELLKAAAKRAHLPLSAWIRSTCLTIAEQAPSKNQRRR